MQFLTIGSFLLALIISQALESFIISNYTSNPLTLILYWTMHAVLVMILLEALIGLFVKRENLATTKEVYMMFKRNHQKNKIMAYLLMFGLLLLIFSYITLVLKENIVTNLLLIGSILLFGYYFIKLFQTDRKNDLFRKE